MYYIHINSIHPGNMSAASFHFGHKGEPAFNRSGDGRLDTSDHVAVPLAQGAARDSRLSVIPIAVE